MTKTANKNPHAVALGRLGGQQTSPKKTAACQRNAQRSALLRKQRAKKAA